MAKKPTGGPIHPRMIRTEDGERFVPGATLRDMFAAAALVGIIASGSYTAAASAREAWIRADEMIAARDE